MITGEIVCLTGNEFSCFRCAQCNIRPSYDSVTRLTGLISPGIFEGIEVPVLIPLRVFSPKKVQSGSSSGTF